MMPKVTSSKSCSESEGKQKTPHSRRRFATFTVKFTHKSRKPWATREETGKRINRGAGTIFNTNAETENDCDEDMVIDLGDVDVDEEVCLLLSFSCFLSLIDNVVSRHLLQLDRFRLPPLAPEYKGLCVCNGACRQPCSMTASF
jgi:hypothetical protein